MVIVCVLRLCLLFCFFFFPLGISQAVAPLLSAESFLAPLLTVLSLVGSAALSLVGSVALSLVESSALIDGRDALFTGAGFGERKRKGRGRGGGEGSQGECGADVGAGVIEREVVKRRGLVEEWEVVKGLVVRAR